jgi:hypothetical protein
VAAQQIKQDAAMFDRGGTSVTVEDVILARFRNAAAA